MAEREVSWTALAEDDLMRVVEFVAADNPVTAERILERMRNRAASLTGMAERGRPVPELRAAPIRQPRELTIRPWRLFYVIDGNRVHVTALFDGRRDVARLLRDRFARGGQQT